MKFIEYEKMSKKEKKIVNNKKRKLWEVNPITKFVESKKKYDRNAFKRGVIC